MFRPFEPCCAAAGPQSVARTPAFIFSVPKIKRSLATLRENLASTDLRVLYSVKACGAMPVVEALRGLVDGFSVASPGEAFLLEHISGRCAPIHLTSPGLTAEWLTSSNATHVSFNSIPQYERLRASLGSHVRVGVRVNPEYSYASDVRYDPCREHSKLGVRFAELQEWLAVGRPDFSGIHIHNACLADTWQPLERTVALVVQRMERALKHIEWINLGGGYMWHQETDFAPVNRVVETLTSDYGLEVFIEPGAGLVNSAGCLVASVIDLFESGGKRLAILDTCVNHLPEAFEYQFEPDVREHSNNGSHDYILAGCSCLAGDVFGEYSFAQRLEIGSRVTFENVGAYSIAKAHMFNGISLPAIYVVDPHGRFQLIKEFGFHDFANHCGATTNDHANL